jgi:hypothetical protein
MNDYDLEQDSKDAVDLMRGCLWILFVVGVIMLVSGWLLVR